MSDEYQAYKHFYLEVPISINNIFINGKPAFTDGLFDNDDLKSFLPIGSAVYMPIIKDSESTFAKRADARIGTLSDIDLLSRTVTIALDTDYKGKEIGNMLSEIDDDTFHYYAGLNIYVRLDRLQLIRGQKEKSNVILLRVSRHDDKIKSKANAEHNSECASPFSPSAVAADDSDEVEEKINNTDTSPFLTKEEAAKTYLTHNSIDLSNYYTKSQVDALIKHQEIISNSSSSTDINNRYDENILIPITASNVDAWIARYIYSYSDRFKNSISCGTKFTIYDGEYNTQWVVVGADTELNKGDVPLTKPHLSLIPVINLGEAMMNDAGTISTYADSKMNRETIPAIVKALQKVLGSHLLARRVKLANNIDSNGKSNGSAYYTVYANLMCARQISGNLNHIYENGYDIGDDAIPLPGLSKYKDNICGSFDFWLRSVYYNDIFVCVDRYGGVVEGLASASFGVRPLITIG